MAMHAVARGRVSAEPALVTTDDGTATVFVVGSSSDRADPVGYQVCCREPGLCQLVRTQVHTGDAVVVVGVVALERIPVPVEDDLSATRVSLEAVAVARDLVT
jgi:hypothetical protein